jgi:hypothetical protein
MNILELFAEKYLSNYDIFSPLNRDIIDDGNCYFHALEYANGDLTGNVKQDPDIQKCIKSSRRNITNIYYDFLEHIIRSIEQIAQIYPTIQERRAIEKQNNLKYYLDERTHMEEYGTTKEVAEEPIIRQGVIFKQKAICILKVDERYPAALTFQILTNPEIGLHFNVNNIIFLINEISITKEKKKWVVKGNHFITFRNSKCRRIVPNNLFFKIISDIVDSEIATYGGIGPDGIMDFIFNIENVDKEIMYDERLVPLKKEPLSGISLSESIKRQMKGFNNQGSPNSTISSLTNQSYNAEGVSLTNSMKKDMEGFDNNDSYHTSISSTNNSSPEGVSLTQSLKEAEKQFANNETPNSQRFFRGRYQTQRVQPRGHNAQVNKSTRGRQTRNSHKSNGKLPKNKSTKYKGTSLNKSSRSSSRSQSSRSQSTQGHSNVSL